MASIIYKPHCGYCGFIIDTSEYEIEYMPIRDLSGKFSVKIPNECPHCGAIFDSIEIEQSKQFEDLYEF